MRIYLYTLSCVVVSVALFIAIVIWMRPTPEDFRRAREIGLSWQTEHAFGPDSGRPGPGGPGGVAGSAGVETHELIIRHDSPDHDPGFELWAPDPPDGPQVVVVGPLAGMPGRMPGAMPGAMPGPMTAPLPGPPPGTGFGFGPPHEFGVPPPPGFPPPRVRFIGGPSGPSSKLFLVSGAVLIVIVLIASAFFARSLVRPLRRLEATALAFGRGDQTARTGLDRPDEIGAAARAFDEMADRTTLLMRSERELMANVSHELRTPLARMRVALDLAAEGDAETAREVTSEIDRDVTELEALIDAVLTSMQLDLAAAPLRRQPIAPDELARRAEQRSRGLGHEHAIRVTAPPEMREIDVDPVLVRRVLDNLIDNARKYSDLAAPIDVRVSETPTTAVFEVEDRGIGIAASDLDQIFTPFFRADRSRQRGTGGVGLGLSLAHKIVAAHGGELTVRSKVGAGSVFRVELPARCPHASPALVRSI